MTNIVEFLRTDKATDWIKSKFSNENEIARFKSNIVAISNSNELLQKADPKTICSIPHTFYRLQQNKKK